MLNYIVRRILLMIPTVIGTTLLVFLVMALSPGGLAASFKNAEGSMRPEERKKIQEYYMKRYGLDQPLWKQYLRWLNQVSPIGLKTHEDGSYGHVTFKWPDLGESFIRRRPVVDVFKETIPITLLLNAISVPIIYSIAIVTGIYSAKKRGKTFDVATNIIYLALWSLPIMWVGVMMLGYLCNRDKLAWFPTGGLHDTLADTMPFFAHWTSDGFQRGWLLDVLWHLVLPVICVSYSGFAFLAKLMRSSVLENLNADFARTARAKGLPENLVLFRHVLSNSLLPLITVAAYILPGMLSGALITEIIFSINGMGRLMVEAIMMKDREIVMSETLVVGIITLVSLLIADILYAVADPRVTYD
ncbi:MAG TPA: ABC transporter permease [Tepidisphaeraceae bacterium]|jgi:ABC-type dipeptide/oligopeptide/nickel transport system permease component|nr:ABC transporter permease [Tepidisphaeraceae bacterium]